MAKASKHDMGSGSHGKGSGTGGMTDLQDDLVGDNAVLSNRDKAQHSPERGLDSKTVQVEQFQDNSASHEVPGQDAGDAVGNSSGLSGPMSDTSSDKSSIAREP